MLYRLKTSKVFEKSRPKRADGDACGPAAPELVKPHLAVKQLAMCPESRMLAVAGASGHAMLFKFRRQETGGETAALDVSLFFDGADELQGSPSCGPAVAGLELCSRKVKWRSLVTCRNGPEVYRSSCRLNCRSSATRSPCARAPTGARPAFKWISCASARGWTTRRPVP